MIEFRLFAIWPLVLLGIVLLSAPVLAAVDGPAVTGDYDGGTKLRTARGSIVQAPEKFGYSMQCYERNGVSARTAYAEWYFVRNRKTIAECLGLAGQLPVRDETYMTESGNPCDAVTIEQGVTIQRGPKFPRANSIRCKSVDARRVVMVATATPRLPSAPTYYDAPRSPVAALPKAPQFLDSRFAPSPPAAPTQAARAIPSPSLDAVASAPFESASKTPNAFHGAPSDIVSIVRDAAVANGLNPRLLLSIVSAESGFNPRAQSPKGAVGLMQLMPDTARGLGLDPALRSNPRQNLNAGARYIKSLLKRYNNNLSMALAAYNAGPDTVDKAGGIPNYPETQDYVRKILLSFKPDIYSVYLARD